MKMNGIYWKWDAGVRGTEMSQGHKNRQSTPTWGAEQARKVTKLWVKNQP